MAIAIARMEGRRALGPDRALNVSRLKTDLLLGLSLRGLGALAGFALAWMIAQMFGARIVGLYQIAFTTATFLAAMALIGQDVVVVREIAPLLKDDRLAEASSRFRGSRRMVLGIGVVLALITAAAAMPLAQYGLDDAAAAGFIIVLAPAIVLLVQLRTHAALLRSLGKVMLSQTLEGVSYTTIAVIGLGALWLFGAEPAPLAAPALLLAGLVLSAAAGWRAVARALAAMPSDLPPVRPDMRSGLRVASGPILTQAGNWLALLAIAGLMSAAEGGIFRIAVQVCMLMQLINGSFATMAGPHLARAANAGDTRQLRRTILTAGGIGIALSAPLGLLALLLPAWIMGLFGPEFVSGAAALQWLTIGQLINVAAGPVGVALIMQRREALVMTVEVCANLTLIGLTVLLLPHWGLAGAGFATFAASLVRNGANWLFCWFGAPRQPSS